MLIWLWRDVNIWFIEGAANCITVQSLLLSYIKLFFGKLWCSRLSHWFTRWFPTSDFKKWLDSWSYFNFGAGCGRSAFFVSVEVFRKQAADEVTVKRNNLFQLSLRFQTMLDHYTSVRRSILINTVCTIYTYCSLLCISAMRSVKSTSLFLSQKPLMSYDTWFETRCKIQSFLVGNLAKGILDFVINQKTSCRLYSICAWYIIIDIILSKDAK